MDDLVEASLLRFSGTIRTNIGEPVFPGQSAIHGVSGPISRLDDAPCGLVGRHLVLDELDHLREVELNAIDMMSS